MSELGDLRTAFHAALLSSGILATDGAGVASIADKHSNSSKAFAAGMIARLGGSEGGVRLAGQVAGNRFEVIVASFVEAALPLLRTVRPGRFEILKGDTRQAIAGCEQFSHLADLAAAVRANPELAVTLGLDYLIKPDVMVIRHPEPDATFNQAGLIVDETVARHAALRSVNNPLPTLHASISCKWTLRSDRAQNARSEALNMIRNRKGKLPHIVVVTAEPMPGRLSSLALGTGDIDCVYHVALPELVAAVDATSYDDAQDLLATMIRGQRLRDIADLPLDLAI